MTCSCATVDTVDLGELPAALEGYALGLSEPGSVQFSTTAGTRPGLWGCPVSYETCTPARLATDLVVMLAHGFMRDLTSMRGWAAHWASHGIMVTVVSLCNSSWLDGRHDRNAQDLRDLASSLHRGPVIYAGFSAGGLAAYLAAAADPRATGYLGLDAVDSGGLAGPLSETFAVPALFLLGEPSACNAQNNFLRALPSAQGVTAMRILHATHCHFENPYDPRCGRVCGRVEPPEAAARITQTIRSLATAWLLHQGGADAEASELVAEARDGSGLWSDRVLRLR